MDYNFVLKLFQNFRKWIRQYIGHFNRHYNPLWKSRSLSVKSMVPVALDNTVTCDYSTPDAPFEANLIFLASFLTVIIACIVFAVVLKKWHRKQRETAKTRDMATETDGSLFPSAPPSHAEESFTISEENQAMILLHETHSQYLDALHGIVHNVYDSVYELAADLNRGGNSTVCLDNDLRLLEIYHRLGTVEEKLDLFGEIIMHTSLKENEVLLDAADNGESRGANLPDRLDNDGCLFEISRRLGSVEEKLNSFRELMMHSSVRENNALQDVTGNEEARDDEASFPDPLLMQEVEDQLLAERRDDDQDNDKPVNPQATGADEY